MQGLYKKEWKLLALQITQKCRGCKENVNVPRVVYVEQNV